MKCLFPIPPETAADLKRQNEIYLGYQVIFCNSKMAEILTKSLPVRDASSPCEATARFRSNSMESQQ